MEVESNIYYNPSQINSSSGLRTNVINALNEYASNVEINKFGDDFNIKLKNID